MDVSTLLVANAQSAKLVKPGKAPFDHPPPSAQSAAMFSVAHGKQGEYASVTQPLPDRLRIIATVTDHTIWSMAWPAPLALQWRNGINKRQRLLRVVAVGASKLNG